MIDLNYKDHEAIWYGGRKMKILNVSKLGNKLKGEKSVKDFQLLKKKIGSRKHLKI